MENPDNGIILIVDDMPNNLGVLLDYLSDRGFEVLVALDGESAIEQAEYAQPNLILLDVMMPGIDGFETCRRLKANETTKEIPVIFITVLSETGDKVTGFSAGAVDYVNKPIQEDEVLARVKTHLSLRNLQKQLQQQNERLQQEIAERYRAEQAIQKLNEQLKQQATQLEAANKELEAFSYSVSHDLRNPISIINGFVWLLKQKYSPQMDEQGQQYLQRIQEANNRMTQLTEDLLHLAKVTRTEMFIDTVNLSDIVREIAIYLQRISPERIVDFVIAENIFAQGDERLLKILLENLLSNAWKYTSKHPQARIEFGMLAQGRKCEEKSQKEQDFKFLPLMDLPRTFFVRDDGAGFDIEQANKLFTPFQRLHGIDDFEGNGIGLATVQRIVHRHGGRIWASAAVEQGASFYFTLG